MPLLKKKGEKVDKQSISTKKREKKEREKRREKYCILQIFLVRLA
jgi:predicted nucleic acid-binding Zn ribbon protein